MALMIVLFSEIEVDKKVCNILQIETLTESEMLANLVTSHTEFRS